MDHPLLMELASKIHNTIEGQGVCIMYGDHTIPVGCFHLGPGLGICEGLARTILSSYDVVKKGL